MRFAPSTAALLTAGLIAGGYALGQVIPDPLISEHCDPISNALAAAGIFLALIGLRNRPLHVAYWVLSLALAIKNLSAGLSLAGAGIWIELEHKQFFVKGDGGSPFFKGILRAIGFIPLVSVAVTACHAELIFSMPNLWYGLVAFGAFLAHDLARKIDPKTAIAGHAIVLMLAATGLAAYAAGKLEVLHFTIWGAGFLLAFLPVLYVKPSRAKILRGAAFVSLLIHLFSPVLKKLLSSNG